MIALLLTSLSVLLGEARWLDPQSDRATLLSTSPGECLSLEAVDPLVEVGRAAFRSPLLFGGQAARIGLSCNACHRDGRDNPAFFIEGLSAGPGAADVTSSMFSKILEDGAFNPAPIPSLVSDGAAPSQANDLRRFIAHVVTDEFQGTPPPRLVDAIAAYVAALDPQHCPKSPVARTAAGDLSDVRRALRAADRAIGRGDMPTADFLLASARAALGAVHERFPGAENRKARRALAKFSKGIAAVRLRASAQPGKARSQLAIIDRKIERSLKTVAKASGSSLYERHALSRAIDDAKD